MRFVLFTVLAASLLSSTAFAAGGQPEKTRRLIAVLQSDAPLFDKARACQQLGEIGTPEAVPALAAALADEHLGAYARSGLEGIADPTAADALRTAAGRLKGNLLAGVVNSLGALRDTQAVGLLRALAADPGSGVVKEALLALGRVANVESVAFLRQALTDGPEAGRADAAAACLLAAEQQIAAGRHEAAIALYDAVRSVTLPAAYRAGATRGAILARKSDGVPFLVEQLRSEDRVVRNAALGTIREIPSDDLAGALNAQLPKAAPELQVQLLLALVDCHNSQSLPGIQTAAASEHPEIRRTALRVLGQIGGPAEAGFLLQTLAENRSPDDAAVAISSLGRMTGAGVDQRIVQALASARTGAARVQLIRLTEGRGMTNATGELLKQAADPEERVSVAALGALKSLAGPADLPALIALVKTARNDAVRDAAETAVCSTGTRTGAPAAGEAALAHLKSATASPEKNAWVRILTCLGYGPAWPVLQATLADADPAVALHTAEQLGHWPDPTPTEALLAVAETHSNAGVRKQALRSAIQLATAAADEHQRPDEVVVGWFRRANKGAQSNEDKRSIISGLGRLKHVESFRVLAPYLDDPGLRSEAAVALVQMAPGLVKQDGGAALKTALENIAATGPTAEVRNQASKIAQTLPTRSGPVLLFDGHSLAGWEGNTNVWRVRDGAIVGGSMSGNPRNEFLATTRNFTNFVLRLEYRLVGTEGFVNGGVQVRSVRVKQPANEMSGYQADIGAGYSGFLYDESRRNQMLARAPDALIKRLEKPGDWNRYEVRCVGPRIQITLNGETTVDYTEPEAAIPRHGLIALQIHGNCKAEIAFRRLLIEELPSDAEDPKPRAAAGAPRPYPDRLRWWAEGRFGMFIHWGPVSLKGTEISWSRANTNPKCPNRGAIPAEVYDNLYREFNPTNFDAAQWVGLAKAAGMKYLVLTAKHCDGFLLWHSQASDYNMARTPFRRDICAELAKAARDQGVRIGWYFSPMDWRDPDFRTERNAVFLGRMQAEVRELLSNYGPIDLLWFDWDGHEPLYEQQQTYQLVKSLQPRIVINNRLDLGPGSSDRQILSTNADYYTPEQQVGAYDDQRPWESCMTTSRKGQWAWGGPQDGVKSFEECLGMLIRCAGGDGNVLLNVGPMPTGEIAPEQATLLRAMGAWLARYGESIYATRGGPFKPGDYGVSTRRGNTIYLHLLEWADDVLKLPPIPAKVVRSRVLSGGKAEVRQTAAGLEVSVPEHDRQPIDTVVALELDGPALDLAAVAVPAPVSLTTKAKATASNIYQNQAEYGADKAVDGRGDTRWATDSGVKAAWLEVDLGQPVTFSRAVIKQAYPELKRVRRFAIEYWESDRWRVCLQGMDLGASFTASFKPVTAQRVRLNITEATDGPTIREFQLFRQNP